jgi:hypothetical protein
MNPAIPEDLISAYLDGEVTSEERVLVESAMSKSAELRQLYQDLRSLQVDLRSLPRHQLGTDFAQRITDRIGRDAVRPAARIEPSRQRANWRRWQPAMAMAISITAVLLVALLVNLRSGSKGRPEGPGQQVASTSSGKGAGLPSGAEPVEKGPLSVGPSIETGRAPSDSIRLVDTESMPKLVLVLDLTITPEGQKIGVFEDALKKAGIRVNPDIVVDEKLEKQLLANRFIGDVEKTDRAARKGRSASSPDEVEMHYIVGPGLQVDAALKDLQNRPAKYVARKKYDLVMQPADMEMFKLLHSAARVAGGPKPEALRVHRLSFRFSLRSASAGFMGSMARPMFKAELVPDKAPVKADASASNQVSPAPMKMDLSMIAPSGNTRAVATGNAPDGEGDNIRCEALVILRNLPSP